MSRMCANTVAQASAKTRGLSPARTGRLGPSALLLQGHGDPALLCSHDGGAGSHAGAQKSCAGE